MEALRKEANRPHELQPIQRGGKLGPEDFWIGFWRKSSSVLPKDIRDGSTT
jgi:hypothetical protein